MPVTKELAIRFALHGCTNRPFFHLVVLQRHKARNSKPVEVLGSYDPMPNKHNEKLVAINFERLNYWLGKGAKPNKTAAEILGLSGYFPLTPMTYIKAKRNRTKLQEQQLSQTQTAQEPIETEL